MDTSTIQKWYKLNYEKRLLGRQTLVKDIEPLLQSLPTNIFVKTQIGTSENGLPIYSINVGKGKKRILLWSQMHGNENTGTKALFDLFKLIVCDNTYLQKKVSFLLNECTLCIIPILNPDGSVIFTRENANRIDLNRDAVAQKAVESKLLRNVLEQFEPKFCFNLHDQRSIFNVEGTENPATISFLAPSEDEKRTLTEGRKQTMDVIVAMNNWLQQCIPNQIGRYTDEFYPTATGDNFQKLGYNTILIEAGHYKNDYNREKTREFNFYALLIGLIHISENKSFKNYKPYFEIPNNDKKFLDVIYSNVTVNNDITDIGIQYKFKVENEKLIMYPHIEIQGNLENYYTYRRIDSEKKTLKELKLLNS